MLDLSESSCSWGVDVTCSSNDDGFTDFGEVATQRLTCVGGELDEDAPTVVRIGTPHEDAFADHRLEPAQGGRRRDGGGDAQARHGDAELGNFCLEQVEQHVPCGVGEKLLGEIA